MHASNSTNNRQESEFQIRGGTFDAAASLTSKTNYSCQELSNDWNTTAPCDDENHNFDAGVLAVIRVSDNMLAGDILVAGTSVELVLSDDYYTSDLYAVNLIGIGHSAALETPFSAQYSNLLDSLVNSGIIEARVFGVAIGEDRGQVYGHLEPGDLTLGGFNPNRMNAPCKTIDFLPTPHYNEAESQEVDLVHRPVIAITNVTIRSPNINQTFTTFPSQPVSYAAEITYSSAWWFVPPEVFMAIAQSLGLKGVDASGKVNIFRCDNRIVSPDVYVEFGGRLTHQVLSLIVPTIDPDETQRFDPEGKSLCSLIVRAGNMSHDRPFLSTGYHIIRDLYNIFDYDNGQITMAPRLMSTSDDMPVIKVGKGPNAVQEALDEAPLDATLRPTETVPPNTATLARPASDISTSLRAITVAPLVWDGEDQNYLPLDARTSTVSFVPSVISSGTQSFLPSAQTSAPALTSDAVNSTTGMACSDVNFHSTLTLRLLVVSMSILLPVVLAF